MKPLVPFANQDTTSSLAKSGNNFDCLRLFAALLVVYSHSYLIFRMPEPLVAGANRYHMNITAGSLGVTIFFITSGFLITGSYFNNEGNMRNYFLSRLLRIYPALITNCLVMALILGMLASSIHAGDYYISLLKHGFVYFLYLIFSVFIPWLAAGTPNMEYYLTYMFPKLPGTSLHNGSLWTLFYEVNMYLGIPVIFSLRSFCTPRILISCAVIFYGAVLGFNCGFNPKIGLELGLVDCWSFLLGSFIYLFRSQIPRNIFIMLAGVAALLLSRDSAWYMLLYTLVTAYTVIYIAFLPGVLGRCPLYAYGDYSYGIYLYAYPVQQYCYVLFADNYPLYLISSLAIIFTLAIVSWHVVEKPALRLKPKHRKYPVTQNHPDPAEGSVK